MCYSNLEVFWMNKNRLKQYQKKNTKKESEKMNKNYWKKKYQRIRIKIKQRLKKIILNWLKPIKSMKGQN